MPLLVYFLSTHPSSPSSKTPQNHCSTAPVTRDQPCHPSPPRKTQQAPSNRLISSVNSNLVFPLRCTHSCLQTNSEGRLISLSHSIFCTPQGTLTQYNIKIPRWDTSCLQEIPEPDCQSTILFIFLWHKHTRKKENQNTIRPSPLWKQII